MPWAIYDYLGPQGVNEFYTWCGSLQKAELAKINYRIDMLEQHGPGLAPKILSGPIRGQRHIYKLVINGRIALRPLLCRGPVRPNEEFTMLMGALEVGWKWEPRDAPARSEKRRQEVSANFQDRRCSHEQYTGDNVCT